MRREPGRGLIRQQRHLARLERSADALGFAFDAGRIEACLATLDGETGALRVRLELRADGACAVTSAPHAAMPEGKVWKLAVAGTRIDEADPLIRHKTTRRHVYEAARAAFAPEEADEVVLLNSAGAVCEGTITNIFLRGGDGILLTPPLRDGLLPGILREELIETGRAREAGIAVADLAGAELMVGNSLRGLIAARLAREAK